MFQVALLVNHPTLGRGAASLYVGTGGVMADIIEETALKTLNFVGDAKTKVVKGDNGYVCRSVAQYLSCTADEAYKHLAGTM